jgi:molybdopterin molybdotransferase
MFSFEEARAKVIEVVGAHAGAPTKIAATETVDISRDPSAALGRILAEDLLADRNYPPFNRSIRDGFALRATDTAVPGTRLRCVGESRSGVAFDGAVGEGECVRILTGAPVPRGANAVLMHEHTRVEGDFVVPEQAAQVGQHYVLAGAEARVGEVVVPRGTRLSYAELAMAAEVGKGRLVVSRRPRVQVLSTGDELVEVGDKPGPYQIRNSNGISLAAQVALVGGEPVLAGSARDEASELRTSIEDALSGDVLILSGGVSAGRYDLVETVLQSLGAEIYFDAVAIRPGKPAVFGWCCGKPVFALPGNPVSTMVTFELFVLPAIEVLSGRTPQPLPFFKAKLAHPVTEKGRVAHFLPARVTWPSGETGGDPRVEVLLWEGSGDIGAVVRANCFLVVHPTRLQLESGEWVDIFLRRGKL